MSYNIAIDGPAGAGKSTIAKKLAASLGYIYVDTGAMYRALAYYFLTHNLDLDNEEVISNAVKDAKVEIAYEEGSQKVYLNGEDVSGIIRQEEVGNAASKTSAYKAVRAHLLSLQQDLAAQNNVIMDGRDIGTTVLPGADLKIFLTASVKTRAKRRYDELVQKGETPDLSKIEADIETRDYQDMTRKISPLTQASDAILLDSSDLGIEEVVAKIKSYM